MDKKDLSGLKREELVDFVYDLMDNEDNKDPQDSKDSAGETGKQPTVDKQQVKKEKDKTTTTVPMPAGYDGGKAGHFSADSEDGIYVCGYISFVPRDDTPQQTQPEQTTQPTETQAEKTE